MLAGVIGPLLGGVASVVRGEDQQVVGAHRGKPALHGRVDLLERGVEAGGVLAVAVHRVGVDQVGEHQPGAPVPEQRVERRDRRRVVVGRTLLRDSAAGEDLAHLPDRAHRGTHLGEQVQVGAIRRRQCEVAAPRRAPERTRLAPERPRDHPAHRVVAGEDRARGGADPVQLVGRDDVDMCGHLEDRVLRRVDDQVARLEVPRPVLLDRAQALRRRVAQHTAPRGLREPVDHLGREPVRVRGPSRGRGPHQLPVPGGRVLARPARPQPPVDRRMLRRGHALDGRHVPQSEPLERRDPEPADGLGHVGERVRPGVAVPVRVGKRAAAHGVEHDHEGSPPHARFLAALRLAIESPAGGRGSTRP